MGGGDDRDVAEPLEQHTKEMRAAHVRVDEVDAALADERGDPPEFIGGPPVQVGGHDR